MIANWKARIKDYKYNKCKIPENHSFSNYSKI